MSSEQASPPGATAYHRQVAEQKRSALVAAATRLFLAQGYSGASLARIAVDAGVSRATLFKQFPTKAALFDAMVTESWAPGADDGPLPAAGDLRAGLRALGTRYAELLGRPEMVDLYRIVIAEAPRFPELSRTHFDTGKMPFYVAVRDYLAAERAAGTARIDDLDIATTHFLGMIANVVLWPGLLLPGWDPGPEMVATSVAEAVETIGARYGTPWPA
ncbi:TetR/AcrR family transcriptional regulator [Pseudonocardia nematodicida]|uniref:TetR/AcrR family transcriptional regulator n=1 Tax=Pseudonocardia nematodicida TaxID=1206997 RepID=A0ABV1K7S4_9PSEU